MEYRKQKRADKLTCQMAELLNQGQNESTKIETRHTA